MTFDVLAIKYYTYQKGCLFNKYFLLFFNFVWMIYFDLNLNKFVNLL